MKTFFKFILAVASLTMIVCGGYGLLSYLGGTYLLENHNLQLILSIVVAALGVIINIANSLSKNERIVYVDKKQEPAKIPVEAVKVEKASVVEQKQIDVTQPIKTIEETEEILQQTMINPIILENGVVSDVEVEQEDNWPNASETPVDIDDITRVFAPVDEEKIVQAHASVPTVELVSPLGPKGTKKKTIEIKEEEKEDYIIPDIAFTVSDDEIEEETEAPKPEEAIDLSKTQERFIKESNLSYISEDGRPQFKITENIPRVTDIPEIIVEENEDFVGYDDIAEKKDRVSGIINGVIAFLFVLLAIVIIFMIYVKFF